VARGLPEELASLRCAKEEAIMAAHPGERARKTGTFHCKGCKKTVRLQKGDTIPKCPCGNGDYDERTDEPGNKSSS